MGAGFSTTANCLYVAVDKPVYSPGDEMSGRVLLNCVTPCKAESLTLKVIGYESTRWHTHSHSNGHSHTHTHTGRREIYAAHFLLSQYQQGMIAPGQYEYAFRCVLPAGLPASFDMRQDHDMSRDVKAAKIAYKAKAELHIPGMFKPNLRHKCRLTVQPHAITRPPHEQLVQATQPLVMCCCFNKGSASITAQLEKDYYFPGEVAHIILQVDNASSVQFSRVQVTLQRWTQLVSNGGVTRTRTNGIASQSFPGLEANTMQTGDQARRLALQIPAVMLPTARGQLVKCTYMVQICCKASMMVSDLVVHIPVEIRMAAPAVPIYTQPPPEWQPQNVVKGQVVEL